MKFKGKVSAIHLASEGLSSVQLAVQGMPPLVLSMSDDQAAEMVPLKRKRVVITIEEDTDPASAEIEAAVAPRPLP